ncbi:unnamed protein product [marine sediment metagenome]|uniref:Uncharacterized protein n=1 Tax=marine sediment metagenome TaxID=412755 RepID=X1AL49_9ZZZZ
MRIFLSAAFIVGQYRNAAYIIMTQIPAVINPMRIDIVLDISIVIEGSIFGSTKKRTPLVMKRENIPVRMELKRTLPR